MNLVNATFDHILWSVHCQLCHPYALNARNKYILSVKLFTCQNMILGKTGSALSRKWWQSSRKKNQHILKINAISTVAKVVSVLNLSALFPFAAHKVHYMLNCNPHEMRRTRICMCNSKVTKRFFNRRMLMLDAHHNFHISTALLS